MITLICQILTDFSLFDTNHLPIISVKYLGDIFTR